MKKEDKSLSENSRKAPAVDPTDPRQAAFVTGGITGAVAGAALGSVGGPAGVIAGAAIGGVAGAKSAEDIYVDKAAEETYWQTNWKTRPYIDSTKKYADYSSAYRVGYDIPEEIYRDRDASFEGSEDVLREHYEALDDSDMPWDDARPAAKDAFDRVIKSRNDRFGSTKDSKSRNM